MLTAEQMQLVEQWKQARDTATQWNAYERQLRDHIASTIFPAGKDGTHRVTLVTGHELKLVRTTTWNIKDDDVFTGLIQYLTYNLPKTLDLFKWKPRLSVGAYHRAPSNVQELVNPVLTSSQSAPQLSIEPVK